MSRTQSKPSGSADRRGTLPARIAAIAMAMILSCPVGALAQGAAGQPPPKQILLTERQVQSYIAAQQDMNALAERQQKAAKKADQKAAQAQFADVAKKHGFSSLDEFGAVASQISLVMTGIDPETKAFSEPPEALRKQIEEVKADKNIPAKDKQQILKDLAEAQKTAQPVEHKANVELVKKYYDKIAPSTN
jgi:homoserine dehydrogenase